MLLLNLLLDLNITSTIGGCQVDAFGLTQCPGTSASSLLDFDAVEVAVSVNDNHICILQHTEVDRTHEPLVDQEDTCALVEVLVAERHGVSLVTQNKESDLKLLDVRLQVLLK